MVKRYSLFKMFKKKILSPHYVFPGKFGLKRHQALQSAVTHVPDSQSLGSHDNPYTIIKF